MKCFLSLSLIPFVHRYDLQSLGNLVISQGIPSSDCMISHLFSFLLSFWSFSEWRLQQAHPCPVHGTPQPCCVRCYNVLRSYQAAAVGEQPNFAVQEMQQPSNHQDQTARFILTKGGGECWIGTGTTGGCLSSASPCMYLLFPLCSMDGEWTWNLMHF